MQALGQGSAALRGGGTNGAMLAASGGGGGGSLFHHHIPSNKSTSPPLPSHPLGGESRPGPGVGPGSGVDASGPGVPLTSSPSSHHPPQTTMDVGSTKEEDPHHNNNHNNADHVNSSAHDPNRKRSTILTSVAQAVRERLHLPSGAVTPMGAGLSAKQPPQTQQGGHPPLGHDRSMHQLQQSQQSPDSAVVAALSSRRRSSTHNHNQNQNQNPDDSHHDNSMARSL